MKLSEVKGEAALDLLADIIEPATDIMSDPKVKELVAAKNKAAIVKLLIKDHKKSIIEILAATEGVPVKEYNMNILTLPVKILEILNDKELVDFFTSQASMEDQISSIEPMVNTEEKEE